MNSLSYFIVGSMISLMISLNIVNCNNHQVINKDMLTYKQCLKMATKKLNGVSENDPNYMIWEEKTLSKSYGWIFFPATKQFIAKEDMMHNVPGIMPIVVNKIDSTCIMAPSSISFENFLSDYEKQLKGK